MKINKSVVVFFLLLFVSANVFAVIPLIALAPILESVIESFIIRSAANEVVATIGTAANDASWMTTFSAWFHAGDVVGRIAIASTALAGSTIDVEVSPSDIASAPTGTMGTGYRFASPPTIPASQSSDGQVHILPDSMMQNLDGQTMQIALATWWNALAVTGYQLTNPQNCGNQGDGGYVCQFIQSAIYTDVNLEVTSFYAYPVQIEQTDGIKRILRSGGAFYADANDPDWLPADAAKINGQSDVRFWNANHDAFLDVSASSNGKTVIDYQQQVDPETVRELTTNLDASSIPTSSSEQTQAGTLADTPIAPDPGTSGTPNINFPTDYNRETTQGKVETDLSTAPTVDPRLETEKATLGTNSDAQKQLITDLGNKGQDNESGLLDWSLPQPVAQEFCVDPVVNIFQGTFLARTITFSGFCDSFMKVRALFDWLLYIFTLIYLFRIATSSSNSEA